ncbi:MAG: hypothetical protein RR859_08000 [Ruthenibacterium sp.]
MKTRNIVLTGLLAALLLVAKEVLNFLPNIELVTLLLMLYTLCFPRSITMWAAVVFIFMQGILYGFGIWWVSWLYLWPLLILITWLLRAHTSLLLWAVVAGAFGLSFGALCAIPYWITGGFYAAVSYWFAGIPFDIAHCIGNVLTVLLLFQPLRKAFTKVQIRNTIES